MADTAGARCTCTRPHADFQRQLQRNAGLRVASEAVRRQHLKRSEDATVDRLRLLRRRSITSLGLVGSAFVAALGFGATTDLGINSMTLGAVSGLIFAWATLGRLGWAGQTIKGDTTVERLDSLLFRTMYWIGTFLGTLAAFGSAA